MTEKVFKDPEKQDFGKIFLVLSAAIVIVLGVEVYMEAIGRQPWIAYQDEFKSLELDQLKKEHEKAQALFDEKQKKLANVPTYQAEPMSVANYRERINEIEEFLKSPDYRNSLSEKERLKKRLDELNIQHRFIKADLDAAYYRRDAALEASEHGKDSSRLPQDKDITAIKEKLASNQKEQNQVSAKLAEVEKKVALSETTLARLKRGLDRETSQLASIKERIAKTEARPASIQQVVVGGLGEYERVDRCMTCHQGMERPEFAGSKLVFRPHPDHERLFKAHPIDKVGCTSCHDGQGRALSVAEAHEGDKHFHTPLLKGAMVQSSCVRCHENAPMISSAGQAAQGAALFQTKGCVACHKVDGSPYLTVSQAKLGPDLKAVKGKVRADWLVAWINNPKKIHPRTLMPEFGEKGKGMGKEEAVALASYLTYSSSDLAYSKAATEYATGHSASAESQARGKKIFNERGCLGCHDLGNQKATGPRHVALDGIGDKVSRKWLYAWIENPSAMSDTTIMPKFDLSKEEIASLSDYLMSLKSGNLEENRVEFSQKEIASGDNVERGRSMVKQYGCYSCHNIPGFENNQEKVGPELSDFAAKDESLLFWGTKNAVPHEKRNWYTWTRARLDEPKVFETDRIAALMPNLYLSDEETDKLLVFLKTLSSQRTVEKRHQRLLKPGERELIAGGQLINSYGCTGCHSMYDEERNTVAAGVQSIPLSKYGTIAPNLTPEGERVRTDWLADFLRAPYKMRPYLEARMPAFNFKQGDHKAMVDYFKATARRPAQPGLKETPEVFPVNDPQRGRNLLSQRQCVTCHQVGGAELAAGSKLNWYQDIRTARKMAPDLSGTNRKLDPEWTNRWIENPHAIMPDTTMPNAALTREEVSAIRSYLAAGGAASMKSANQLGVKQ